MSVSKIEMPIQSIGIQIGDQIKLGDGRLELTYLPEHKAAVLTVIIDEQHHASVPLDEATLAVLALFTADPQREPPSVIRV